MSEQEKTTMHANEVTNAGKLNGGEISAGDRKRIETLTAQLNEASDAYYNGQDEKMSNYEWDAMFDELTALEEKTGFRLPDSPTQRVGFEGSGDREPHEYPALSLAKTKRVEELQEWAGSRPVWLSWKLDGLTLVLTYDGGQLQKIVTRGNGTVGSNITFVKSAIHGVPLKLSYPGHLVVRGEAAISYTDFAQINATIEAEDGKYANPRNLASGTLGLDKSNLDKVKERHIHFHAFTLVHLDEEINSWGARMDFLDELGFITVEREQTDAAGLPEVVERWTKRVEQGEMDLPVDGLVICYEDDEYARGGSVTGHHATRGGYAFKWQDVSAETELLYVEWSCAASTISPVAVFEPVQLEGTTVSRASLCNISEMERLGIGQEGHTRLEVIKANKIIPKCIAVKAAQGTFTVPEFCPVCHEKTEVRISGKSGTKTLHCTNPDCTAKHVKKFTRFVSKPGMDIDGLSIQTMLKFMNMGYISDFADVYRLHDHSGEIRTLEGFGDKSCDNMLAAIEKSRNSHPVHFIYALCIPLIGTDAAKRIIDAVGYQGFLSRLEQGEGFEDIDGIGPERSSSIVEWYSDENNRRIFAELLQELHMEQVEAKTASGGKCQGLTFVITGAVHHYKNRDEFKAYVQQENGSVAGSISGKTDYLVNNDLESDSTKNRKAKSLGVPIISEDEFLAMFG